MVDDFEDDRSGAVPSKWLFLDFREQRFMPLEGRMNDREHFFVMKEGGNHFLRAYTHGEAHRITVPASSFKWDLRTRPYIQWKWRAGHLPAKAREDKLNDSGGALYVSFDKRDWLGRPYSIKYVYSSTLPVGTVVSTGNVKVIVASSGLDGIGTWELVTRDVTADYRKVFDGEPPDRPFSITLWSDSDNTGDIAQVDFDDILVK
ncbi:MAG TPA: DUF3047 domain-containing protein [Rhodothermales bacterium]|nr:DUF3047 domain-containing protein [Rhodothermales bacterium]